MRKSSAIATSEPDFGGVTVNARTPELEGHLADVVNAAPIRADSPLAREKAFCVMTGVTN
ncbi:MAG: hypothetical protein KF864_00705 [Phycisphaeraceae bacterium]|nr:hypothetical protein [Phycisphaeraceae bacterium]